ncbi:MAG TPA: large-conductance mechanosensitive channel protein MscL [Tepidisphaeraceae bacterium]|jgi:large conductance mechanosensitive channel
MAGFIAEFKEFALKGSVLDLAVGVIIGAVFGALVTSLVQDIMMPPLGWVAGGLDFQDKRLVLQQKGSKHFISGSELKEDVAIRYGRFINAVINFVIQALAIFLVVKVINRARRKPQPAPEVPPAPTREESILMEIRDLLKNRPVA